MTLSEFAIDRYKVGEEDVTIRPRAGLTTKGIIWCHGSGETASTAFTSWRSAMRRLSKHAIIHVGDLGFQAWGRDEVADDIDAAGTILEGLGVEPPYGLVGMSMGGASALKYAKEHPTKVACVAALIPLVDLANARANPLLTSRWPEIDAIYGAPPADYSDNSPIEFVGDLDPDLPIRIWSSSDDTLAPRSTHDAFVAARPQTEFIDMGAVGHTFPTSFNDEVLGFFARYLLAT